MMKKKKISFLNLVRGSTEYKQVITTLEETFLKGYSVIELARILGVEHPQWIYRELKLIGLIEGVGSGRRPSAEGLIPPLLADALTKIGFSFAKWCTCRSVAIDPCEAVRALREPFPSSCVRAHLYFYYDFKHSYVRTYGQEIEADPCLPYNPDREEFGVSIKQYGAKFVVTKDKDISCYADGPTPSEALKNYLMRDRRNKAIIKMQNLPERACA